MLCNNTYNNIYHQVAAPGPWNAVSIWCDKCYTLSLPFDWPIFINFIGYRWSRAIQNHYNCVLQRCDGFYTYVWYQQWRFLQCCTRLVSELQSSKLTCSILGLIVTLLPHSTNMLVHLHSSSAKAFNKLEAMSSIVINEQRLKTLSYVIHWFSVSHSNILVIKSY